MSNPATALAAMKILRQAGQPVSGLSSEVLIARASALLGKSLEQPRTARLERLPMSSRSSGLAALQRRVDAIDARSSPRGPVKQAADLAADATASWTMRG